MRLSSRKFSADETPLMSPSARKRTTRDEVSLADLLSPHSTHSPRKRAKSLMYDRPISSLNVRATYLPELGNDDEGGVTVQPTPDVTTLSSEQTIELSDILHNSNVPPIADGFDEDDENPVQEAQSSESEGEDANDRSTVFDTATFRYDLPLFQLFNPLLSKTQPVLACPLTVRDFTLACLQIKQQFNLPKTAIDAICGLVRRVVPEQAPGFKSNWTSTVPKNSRVIATIANKMKAAVDHDEGQVFAMCTSEGCESVHPVLVNDQSTSNAVQAQQISRCTKCNSELFTSASLRIPKKRLIFYPIAHSLKRMRLDPQLHAAHVAFMSNIRQKIESRMQSHDEDAPLDDFWDSPVATDLFRQNRLHCRAGEHLLNFCPDGVTPGKRSSFSFWLFASTNLSLPPEMRDDPANMIVHALVEGGITKDSMKTVLQMVVRDIREKFNDHSSDDRPLIVCLSADHQSVRKIVCACGANAEYGCELCQMLGTKASVQSNGSSETRESSNFYYGYENYTGVGSHVHSDGRLRALRLEFVMANEDLATLEKRLSEIQTNRVFLNPGESKTSVEREIADMRKNIKSLSERLRKMGYYDFSPLLHLPHFDVIRQKSEDLMHLLFENVSKELLSVLRGEIKPVVGFEDGGRIEVVCRVTTDQQLLAIDDLIKRSILPSGFERPPALRLKTWRAIDYQNFFLHFAQAVLCESVPEQFYCLIVLFCVGARIFSSDSVRPSQCDIGHKCFLRFYVLWSSLTDRVKLSVHRLVHVASATKSLGPLSKLWLYAFERFFGRHARSIVGSNHKFSQLCDNISSAQLLTSIPSSHNMDVNEDVCRDDVDENVSSAFAEVAGIPYNSLMLPDGYRLVLNRFAKVSRHTLSGDEVECLQQSGMDFVPSAFAIAIDKLESPRSSLVSSVYREKQRRNAHDDRHVAVSSSSGPCFVQVEKIVAIGRNETAALKIVLFAKPHERVDATSSISQVTKLHAVRLANHNTRLVCFDISSVLGNLVLVPHATEGQYLVSVYSRSLDVLEKIVLHDGIMSMDWMNYGSLYALLEQ